MFNCVIGISKTAPIPHINPTRPMSNVLRLLYYWAKLHLMKRMFSLFRRLTDKNTSQVSIRMVIFYDRQCLMQLKKWHPRFYRTYNFLCHKSGSFAIMGLIMIFPCTFHCYVNDALTITPVIPFFRFAVKPMWSRLVTTIKTVTFDFRVAKTIISQGPYVWHHRVQQYWA